LTRVWHSFLNRKGCQERGHLVTVQK